jgi:methyl-accepting chemotaxis protein
MKKLDDDKAKIDSVYETFYANLSAEGKEDAKKYKTGFDNYWKGVEEVKELVRQHRDEKTDKGLRDLMHQGSSVRREAMEHLQDVITLNGTRLEESAKDSETIYNQSRNLISLVSLLAAVGGMMLAFAVLRALGITIDRIIGGLSGASQQVAQASEQIAQAAEELSQASNEQASSLQETSSATEELSSMVQKNTENAKSTSESALRSLKSAQNGKKTVEGMVQAIRKLEETNQQIAAIVGVFSEIQDKAKIIDEIVFQTQLLSFNASVEAARAGEHGKGFAVVAEEVGSLAEMSGAASGEIGTLLAESLKKVENTVQEVQSQIGTLVEEGGRGITVLDEIVNEAQNANQKMQEIAQASEEQSRGIKEISLAMTQLDQGTQQNAATSEETASASEELSGQAVSLRGTVMELVTVIKGAGNTPTEPAGKNADHGSRKNFSSRDNRGGNNVTPLRPRQKTASQGTKFKKAAGAELSTPDDGDDDKDFVNL